MLFTSQTSCVTRCSSATWTLLTAFTIRRHVHIMDHLLHNIHMPSLAKPALAALLTLSLALVGCSSTASQTDTLDSVAAEEGSEEASTSNIARFEAKVLERLPFDASLFTQGLEVTDSGDQIGRAHV